MKKYLKVIGLGLVLLSCGSYAGQENIGAGDPSFEGINKPTPFEVPKLNGAFGSLPLQQEVYMLVKVCKMESKNQAELDKCMDSAKRYYESKKEQELEKLRSKNR
jgi:hypothetical protein